jgi:hypothetical protein
MEEKVLVILAAGMGSRFGGMKQIEPVGPNGEFLIDYSIYSAIRYGFTKVVFIIKEENYEIFKETIGSRVEPHIPVEYVFQKLETIPAEQEALDILDKNASPYDKWKAEPTSNNLYGVVKSLQPTIQASLASIGGNDPNIRSKARVVAAKAI